MKKKILLLLMSLLLLGACSNKNPVEPPKEEVEGEKTYDLDEEVDNEKEDEEEVLVEEDIDLPPIINYQEIQPNEMGHIMIVMYHGIRDLPPFHRTAEDFKKDLTYMYENNYRLISMRDYIDQTIDIAPGMTPIVLTFDDGLSSTFSLVEEDGQLVPAQGTAVAILEEFVSEYPDFGKAAVFYINSHLKVFEGAGTVTERLSWLVDNGYEVSNHTSVHARLNTLDAEGVQEHIGKTDQFIKDILGENYVVDSLSYPFGIRPKQEFLSYALKGSYNGRDYSNSIALRDGPSGPFHPPYHIRFDPLAVPRVIGSEGQVQDMWWFFNDYEKRPHLKYVSDGNKNVISVPDTHKDLINYDRIQDKEVYIYTIE